MQSAANRILYFGVACMSDARDRFESAVRAERVATRFAKDFSTKQELSEYLRAHPKADRAHHRVIPKKDQDAEKQWAKEEGERQNLPAHKRVFTKPKPHPSKGKNHPVYHVGGRDSADFDRAHESYRVKHHVHDGV